MLGVEDHLVDARPQIRDRVGDQLDVLLERDAEVACHRQVPRAADDRHDRRLGFEEHAQVAVGAAGDTRAARRAKGGDARASETERAHRREECRVARIRARPAALDVVHTEGRETLRDPELVLERERDVLALAAVAQRRVVELHRARRAHPRASPPPRNASCRTRTASSTYLASTTTEVLISEVEIIWMLIPTSASARNILAATPA